MVGVAAEDIPKLAQDNDSSGAEAAAGGSGAGSGALMKGPDGAFVWSRHTPKGNGGSDDWSIAKEGRRCTYENDSGSNTDYSTMLSSEGYTEGRHEWSLKLSGSRDGVWIGACSEPPSESYDLGQHYSNLALGVWYWRPDGEMRSCGPNGQGSAKPKVVYRQSEARYRGDDVIKFVLDMDEGTLELFTTSIR